jgi:hypothetical protein
MSQLSFFTDVALQTLRDNWRNVIENEGGRCPCCDRWGKINAHALIESMALSLLWISKQPTDDDGYVNVSRTGPSWVIKGKYSLLKHWDLITKLDRDDKPRQSDGQWQITTKGYQFLRNELPIARKVFIYDNTVQGFSQEEVLFRECFNKHFDYDTVMSDHFNFNEVKV